MTALSSHAEEQRLQTLHEYRVLDTPAEAFFDDLVRVAALVCGTPIALITLIDEDRQWFKAKIGVHVDQTSRDFAFCNHALQNPDELLMVEDASRDHRFSGNLLVTGSTSYRSYAGAPLVAPGGHVLGTLCVVDVVPHALTDAQKEVLKVLARRVVSALETKRAFSDLKILSATDALTGLPNRRAFQEKLRSEVDRSHRYGLPLSLILFDVDHFKRFNDTLGHPAGDFLLQSIAQMLTDCARTTDQVSRLGGDEFATLLPNTGCDVAFYLAERVRRTAESRFQSPPNITLSVGVAELEPNMDCYALMGTADRALYEAKQKGRNRVDR
jgi:diguanylate cyclase (GGDEF)-like protein